MKTHPLFSLIACGAMAFCLAAFSSENEKKDGDKPVKPPEPEITEANKPSFEFKVNPATDEGELAMKKFKLDKDLKCELFAAEPMVANIVAFSIDEKGRFFVSETFRVGEGVIDNRQHMDWLDEDLNSRSVEDRYAFQKRHLGKNLIKEMGIASERVKLVEDRAGKGKADYSTVFASGFDTTLDGVAAGVLARKGTVYLTNIPNLWMLKDTEGKGVATEKKSLYYGFGVRNAFMGHDLHGLKMGPDYRLYFSLGDRGAHIKTAHGVIDNPDSGCVFRCNPDGSNLEIYHTGLRNPQSLAFDRYGNLFTGDNNADSGDKAKWYYIVEGGDSGWRIGWQYINNPKLGAFNTEKMWFEPCPEQPRFLTPPCGHICAGPSGLVYYPGTGLPDKYKDHFFLCDFTGGPTSKVHSFALNPKGASFELIDRAIFQEGCLATDLCFGVQGGLYMSDWVEGWTKTGKGRIYRVYEEKSAADPMVAEVRKILADGFEQRNIDELVGLMGHVDMRIRQEAEFALVDKAENDAAKVIDALNEVVEKKDKTIQSKRLHAMWGLEVIARTRLGAADRIMNVLNDEDPVIRQQAAKMLGERRVAKAAPEIEKLLSDKSARVRFHACNALGKIGSKESVPAILKMIRDAGDKDAYIRHAGTMALVWIGDLEIIKQAALDQSPAVRMISLLAMRKLERPEIGMFCSDKNPDLVLEAARAINDVPISGALPELADLIWKPTYSEPLLRRVLNANYRLGTEDAAKALANFALWDAAPVAMRADALNMLGEWTKPPQRDRITNLFRPIQNTRELGHAAAQVKNAMDQYLKSSIEHPVPEAVRTAGVQACEKLGIIEAAPVFLEIVGDGGAPSSTRVAALKALQSRGDAKLNDAIHIAADSGDSSLRREGMAMLGALNAEEAAPKLASYVEQQILNSKRLNIAMLGEWKGREPERLVAQYMDAVLENKMEKELVLDVLMATEKKMKDPPPPDPKKVEKPADNRRGRRGQGRNASNTREPKYDPYTGRLLPGVKPDDVASDDSKKDDTKKDDTKKDDKKDDTKKDDVAADDSKKDDANKEEDRYPKAEAPAIPYVRPDFKAKLAQYEEMRDKSDILSPYKETLWGGDAGNGRRIFFEKTEVSCIRCHKVGVKGTDVGPNLTDLALRQLKREYYLESIVDPNKQIARGFESAMVKTKDGMMFSGVVKKDDDKELVLSDGTKVNVILKEDIAKRVTAQSPMPQDLVKQLSKVELRDLIEFLAGLKTPIEKPKAEDSRHE